MLLDDRVFTSVREGVEVEIDGLASDDFRAREFVLPGAEQSERMATLKAMEVFGEEALFGDYVQPCEKRKSLSPLCSVEIQVSSVL